MLVEPVASEEHAPRSALRLDTPHDPARHGTVALGLDGGANTRPPPISMAARGRLAHAGTVTPSSGRNVGGQRAPDRKRRALHQAEIGARAGPIWHQKQLGSGSSSSNRLFWRVYVVRIFWDRWADFLREGSRSHLRNGFVQPLVVVVLDEASEGLHPRSPFAVHPVGTVPPRKRERRCGRLEPSWLPPCTWACDCLGRFSSPVTSSTLRCVGFAPPGERLAQTLPVDHRDRQPGSCRSLAGSCSYSRIADLRVLSRF